MVIIASPVFLPVFCLRESQGPLFLKTTMAHKKLKGVKVNPDPLLNLEQKIEVFVISALVE